MSIKNRFRHNKYASIDKKVFICVLLILTSFAGYAHLKTSRNDVLYVIVKPIHATTRLFAHYKHYFTSKDNLIQKLAELQQENESLTQKLCDAHIADKNNIFPKNKAKVVYFINNAANRHLIISKPKNIDSSNAYVTGEHGLIGRIIEEGKFADRVLTILDAKSKIPIYIKETGHQAILVGDSTSLLKLIRINKKRECQESFKATFKEGQVLYTSGVCGIFPRNIAVAKIIKVSNDESTIDIMPIENIFEANDVFVTQTNGAG